MVIYRRLIFWGLSLVGLLACVFLLMYLYIPARYNIHTVIHNQIYRSATPSKEALDYMVRQYHIRSVINLRGKHKRQQWYREETQAAQNNGIAMYNLSLPTKHYPDHQSLLKLVNLYETIEKPVLVHCKYGIDRSGLASAIAVLMSDNASISRAYYQMSWRYWNFNPYSVGWLVLPPYREWLSCSHLSAGPDTFKRWINITHDVYRKLFYCSRPERFVLKSQLKKT